MQSSGALHIQAVPDVGGRPQGSPDLATDLRHADLRGAALRGADLSGRDLTAARLDGADLTGAKLAGAILVDAVLDGAVLFEADLSSAELFGASLDGADLTGSRARWTGFGSARLVNARCEGADFAEATFSRAHLDHANLQAANLAGARLVTASLQHTDLTSAQLDSADLSGSNVAHASFRGASLRNARLAGVVGHTTCDWIGVDLRGADTNGARLLKRFVDDVNFVEEFRSQSGANRILYWLWWITSDCGRSVARWSSWIVVLAVGFSGVYTQLPIHYGDHETWLSPLYFSVVTLTTLGYGDVLPMSVSAQVAVMTEVLCGYVMLGALISIFADKFARRA